MVAYANRHKYKLLVVLALVAGIVMAKRFGAADLLSFDGIRKHVETLRGLYSAHPAAALAIYCAVYVLGTTLSIPVGNALSLAGGAVFGLAVTWPLAVLCTCVGASGAFLISRHLLSDWVERHHGKRADAILHELRDHGAMYLVALRWIMVVPFALINWTMGISEMRIRAFFLATLVGQIPVNFIFVNAGRTISTLDSIGEILSLRLLLAFFAMAILPVALVVRRNLKTGSRDKKCGRGSENRNSRNPDDQTRWIS